MRTSASPAPPRPLLVDRLARAGFVERRPSRIDKRSVELLPTRAALGDTGPLLAAAQEQIAAATAELSPDEAETVTRFLTKMRETVDRIAAERIARTETNLKSRGLLGN